MAGLFEDEPPAAADSPPAFSGPSLFGEEPEPVAPAAAYRVLARKYRPASFDDLIGQDALVRTLRNAFAMNRIAHAFMLTGVRGVGKTTTARILARALNCTAQEGPTASPCGRCDNCVAILADRHPDVVEMDAASNTGVDDVREIIEATRFRPLSARYKIFIIDEVHMLSRNAFNALLKTLEEPPPHVKFIFATTEIRKVPVTVLSRCQRFDLRRVSVAELAKRFARIAGQENIAIAEEAIAHIARAADGSVRDGLSLLDQAMARGAEEGGEISAGMVAEMLGLADRGYIFQLLEALIAGSAADALDILGNAYDRGADVGLLLADLLGLAHLLTRMKTVPALAESTALPEIDRVQGSRLAGSLSISWLARLWQMLLKGIAEVDSAPDRRAAAEMILIRLCHVADMPPPAELMKKLEAQMAQNQNAGNSGGLSAGPSAGVSGGPSGGSLMATAVNAQPMSAAAPAPRIAALPRALTFTDVVALAATRRDLHLAAHLRQSVHLVRFAPPIIELRLRPEAPRDLAPKLAALLEAETNRRWTIALSQAEGEATLDSLQRAAATTALETAANHPIVRAILENFPGARIEPHQETTAQDAEEPPPDWSEFSPPDEALIEEED